MHRRRGCGIAAGEQVVGAGPADAVVQVLPVLAPACGGRRRQPERRDRGAQVEPRAAGDDGRLSAGEDLVDRVVREALVLRDRGLVVEPPDPDEPRGQARLVREDRQPSIDLHRVRRDDLGLEPWEESLGDGALSRGGGPEDRDHGRLFHAPIVLSPRRCRADTKRVSRTHLERRPREMALFIALGALLSIAAIAGVGWAAGLGAVADRLRAVDARWLPLAIAAEVVAYLGYVLAYREVARVEGGPRLPHSRVLALVATGFGVFVARGGFTVDLHAFRQECVDDREARVRVLGLGALEYALLAPATCIVAVLLLAEHTDRPGSGLTMPWAVAVPAGGVVALSALRLRERLRGRRGWRDAIAQWLDSIHVLRQLFVRLEHAAGPLGTALYWFGDIACLALCLRAYEGHFPSVAPLLIGYATGYALTRRTLPLAGAGAVEALLPFALSWSGTPLAAAVPAVLAYRMINFWLPIVPAVFGLRSLRRA
jgi:uncharacterized membrane protein YbhN (UPF0104 family)